MELLSYPDCLDRDWSRIFFSNDVSFYLKTKHFLNNASNESFWAMLTDTRCRLAVVSAVSDLAQHFAWWKLRSKGMCIDNLTTKEACFEKFRKTRGVAK